jgi:protein-S-isoprenylcysteine O-methyltransferase Ste14
MQLSDLRHTLQWLAAGVWIYQIFWASRIFKPVGRLPALLPLFPLAWAFLFYKVFSARLETRLVIPGTVLLVASIALFEWARRSTRQRFFSYAYSTDTPEFLWTSGPYAYIRNPFYTSYIVSYVGAVMLFPSIQAAIVASGLILFFVGAAIREERKFARSPLAVEYEAFKGRTGRFFPRVGK